MSLHALVVVVLETAVIPDANIQNLNATTIALVTRTTRNVTEQTIVMTNPMKILIIAVWFYNSNSPLPFRFSYTDVFINYSTYILFPDKAYPTFENVSCATLSVDAKYTLCFKVVFPGDSATDYALLEEVPNAWKTYTGKFKEEMNGEVPLAFNYPDPEDGETKAVVSLCSLFIRY